MSFNFDEDGIDEEFPTEYPDGPPDEGDGDGGAMVPA